MANVWLAVFPVAPVIPQPPRLVSIEKKRTIMIECKVQAQSEPSVSWYKEKTVIQKSSRHLVHVKQVTQVSGCWE